MNPALPRWVALVLLASTQAQAVQFYPREQLPALLQKINAAPIAKISPQTLAAGLRMALARSTQDALPSEATLHAGLLALRQWPPDAGTQAVVEQLAQYAPQAYSSAADPDHGHEHARSRMVPVFEIAATARGTLRAWEQQSLIRTLQTSLQRADRAALLSVLGTLTSPGSVLSVLSDAQLDMLLALSGEDLPQAVLIAVLQRRPQPDLYRRLLRTPNPDAAALAALAWIPQHLPPADALTLLREAAAVPGHASAALLALAPLAARHDTPTRAYLLTQLAHPQHGGAAAQALSQDTLALNDLSRIVANGGDDLRLRRALLSLSLMDDAAAQELLRRYAADPHQPAELRREIQGWQS